MLFLINRPLTSLARQARTRLRQGYAAAGQYPADPRKAGQAWPDTNTIRCANECELWGSVALGNHKV